jgi:hypothetical protein
VKRAAAVAGVVLCLVLLCAYGALAFGVVHP